MIVDAIHNKSLYVSVSSVSSVCVFFFISRSSRPGQLVDNFVLEPDESVQLAFDDPLLIAVRAESLRAVLDVERRADAVALHPFAAQLRHICRARAHCRQSDGAVDLLRRRLGDLEAFVVEPRAGGGGSLA